MDLSSISNKYSLSFGNKTDVGKVREGNEDYLASFQTKIGHIFIVCDGMGGHTSGEIASRLAVTSLKDYIQDNSESSLSTKQLLIEAIENANQTIIDKTFEIPEYKGMGTTCVMLAIKSGVVYYINIGDSRIYMIRNGIIYQLTKDQTFVQTLVDQGHISYEDADIHPRKNELIQALGINEKIVPEVNEVGLRIYKGDKFILCSDGLSGMITDSMINDIVNSNDPVLASDLLVRAANDNGGTDNITVQVISIVEGDELPEDLKNTPPTGALNKNSFSIKNKAENGRTTRQISDYQLQQSDNKGNRKTGLILIILILLVIFISSYFLFFNKTGNDQTAFTKSDPVNELGDKQNNDKFKKDSLIESFLQKIYLGKVDKFPDKGDFENIEIDEITYIDAVGNKSIIKYDELIKNINDYDLKFVKYNPNNGLYVKNNSGQERLYLINYSLNNSKIKIEKIEFIKKIENNINPDKDKKAVQKNSGNQNANNNDEIKEDQNTNNQKAEEKKTDSEELPESKQKIDDLK